MKLSDFINPAVEWNHNIWPSGHWYSGREPARPMYDPNISRRIHAGVDFAARWGSACVAPADGTVVFVGWQNKGIGNTCITRHENVLIDQPGPFFGQTVTVFHRPGHMAPDYRWGRSRMLVRVGDRVVQGQQLGEVGNSGSSAGPHVHSSLTVGVSEWVDPADDLHLDPEQAFTGSTAGYYFRWQEEDDMERNKADQEALKAAGYYAGAIDGQWGPMSKAAFAKMAADAATTGSGGPFILGPFEATITPTT